MFYGLVVLLAKAVLKPMKNTSKASHVLFISDFLLFEINVLLCLHIQLDYFDAGSSVTTTPISCVWPKMQLGCSVLWFRLSEQPRCLHVLV